VLDSDSASDCFIDFIHVDALLNDEEDGIQDFV
jgi:hypothetical protein